MSRTCLLDRVPWTAYPEFFGYSLQRLLRYGHLRSLLVMSQDRLMVYLPILLVGTHSPVTIVLLLHV